MTIANVAISINNAAILFAGKRRIEKKDLRDLIESDFCSSPVVFQRKYLKKEMANATAMAINGFRKDTKVILCAAALSQTLKFLKSFLGLFFKLVHSNSESFEDCRNDLESSGLIQREGKEDIWSMHNMWQAVSYDVLKEEIESMIANTLDSPTVGASREHETELLQALLFLYGQKNEQERAAKKFDNVPGKYLIYRIRTCLEPFVCMQNANPRDEWEEKSHESAKQVIMEYTRLGKLHDQGMSKLLSTPETCSRACKALNKMARISNNHLLTPQHVLTVQALLEVQSQLCERDSVTAVSAAFALLNLIWRQSTPVETIMMVAEELRASPSFVKLLYIADMQGLIVPTISHMANLNDKISEKIGTLPGVMEALTVLLAQNETPGIQREAAGALANLCLEITENRTRLGSCHGAVEGLVELLSKDMEPKTQEAAALALANLCLNMKEIKMKVGSCPGAVEGLVNLLAKDTDPQIQERACIALANLCWNAVENKMKVGSYPGAVEGLVDLLAKDMNPQTQGRACLTLTNLCRGVTVNKIRVGSCPGAVEGLVRLLHLNPKTQWHGVLLLEVLCQDMENSIRVGTCPEAIERLVELLDKHVSPKTQKIAANTLTNLCANVLENKIKVGSSPGAVGRLLGLVFNSMNPGPQKYASFALANLCRNVTENQIKVGSCPGAVEGLVDLLAKHTHPQSQEGASLVLAILCPNVTENKIRVGSSPGAVEA